MTSAVTLLTRLRLDAPHYVPMPPQAPGQLGRPRLQGHRLPYLRTVSTDSVTRT